MADRRRFSIEREKIYVPKNKKLRIEIIWLYHDVLVVEHGGRKITKLIMRNYW